MTTEKLKKYILPNLPLLFVFWFGDKVCFSYRTATGKDLYTIFTPFLNNLTENLTDFLPSFHIGDLLFGLTMAVLFKLVIEYRKKMPENSATVRSTAVPDGEQQKIFSRILTSKILTTMSFSHRRSF